MKLRSDHWVVAGVGAVFVPFLAGTPVAAKSQRRSADDGRIDASFPVMVKNDCEQAVEARFVVVAPGLGEKEKLSLYQAAPVTVLPPKSETSRSMLPNERLVVLRKSGGRGEGWFDQAERDAKIILWGEKCSVISTEAGAPDEDQGKR